MPEWAKVSHTSFSVRDAEASAAWLQRVLGLEELNVGFQVPSRAALDDWLDHFEALGVEHSPVADRERMRSQQRPK
jgi:glyoxylase I family protein